MTAQVIQRFENAKVGDKVWSCIHGNGEVVGLTESDEYPLKLRFKVDPKATPTITLCGRCYKEDPYAEVYSSEKEFIEERVKFHNYKLGKHMIALQNKTGTIETLGQALKGSEEYTKRLEKVIVLLSLRMLK